MNERIRQLAKQATKEVWGNDPFNGAPTFEGHELDEEKFAELIVAEACLVLEAGKSGVNQVPAEVALHMMQKNLKAYFGVE